MYQNANAAAAFVVAFVFGFGLLVALAAESLLAGIVFVLAFYALLQEIDHYATAEHLRRNTDYHMAHLKFRMRRKPAFIKIFDALLVIMALYALVYVTIVL